MAENSVDSITIHEKVKKSATLLYMIHKEFVKAIIGDRYIAESNAETANPCTYILVKALTQVTFCKHTIRVLLNVGIRNFKIIISNYSLLEKA